MNPKLSWQYDEFKQVGRDYSTQTEVNRYDSSHADFRDIEAESNKALDLLQLKTGDVAIDFGSGTGVFALQAARRGITVHAVDVSQPMLDCARHKSEAAGATGIEFHHSGFLTYQHPEGSADAITTTFAFHHLPDFWKGIALERMIRMLKPGGRLYIHDVILESANAIANISSLIEAQEAAGGAFLREDAEGHFRDEYSTYDWVMDGLLTHAGFSIQRKQIEGGIIGTYLCLKN